MSQPIPTGFDIEAMKKHNPSAYAQAEQMKNQVFNMLGRSARGEMPYQIKIAPTLDELVDWVNDQGTKIAVTSFVPVPNAFAVVFQQVG